TLGTLQAATMTSPTPGSTLTRASATFNWTAGFGVTEYWLTIGTTGVGSKDILNQSTGTAQSMTVNGLPFTGGTIYVRLWSNLNGTWASTDYTYTAVTAVESVLTTPPLGSTVSNVSTNFGWSAGTAVDQYWLSIGMT